MKGGYVYITSNKRDGALYIGVTGNLSRRIWEHREGIIDGFSKRYGLKRLVYYEPYDDIRNALQCEKNMKTLALRVEVHLDPCDEPGLGRPL
jgi:putative endonuclease